MGSGELSCYRRPSVTLFPGTDKDWSAILERLERFNTKLSTRSWRVFSEEKLVERKEAHLVLEIPESYVRTLKILDFQP